jgi:phage I-like protein
MTPEKAKSFAEQFNRKVAGQDLPIFYIHSDKRNVSNPLYGKAAGWITDMKADPARGVVIDIQFTEEGAAAVKKGEYRYLSAEYFDKVQLPHHKHPEMDVVVGASLANRPHLKGMSPILNEETGHQFLPGAATYPSEGGGPVDPILLQLCNAAKISLSEDQTELTEEQRAALTQYLTERDKELTDATASTANLQKQLDDLEDKEEKKMKSLREAGFEEEAKLLEELQAERLEKQLSEFVPEGQTLTKVGKDAISKYAKDRSHENLMALQEALLSGNGTARTEPLGGGGEGDPDKSGGAAERFMEETNKIAQEKELDISQAMLVVQTEKPELWNEYQDEIGSTWAKVEVNK